MPAHPHSDEFEARSRLLSEKLRHRRYELGLTEMDLIERTQLSRGYIQLLMNARGSHKDPVTGKYKLPNPTVDVIWLLADALKLDATYLIDPDRPVESFEPD